VRAGLDAALSEELRAGVARKLSGKEEALLIATPARIRPGDVHVHGQLFKSGRGYWELRHNHRARGAGSYRFNE
jgi:hypothetical protein